MSESSQALTRASSSEIYRSHELASKEIRIFDILRRNRKVVNDPVRITIRTISLAPEPTAGPDPYATLSYTWGKTFSDGSHLTHVVYMDNVPVRVTANLCAALERIRSILDTAYDRAGNARAGVEILSRSMQSALIHRPPLWVDAICINQGDHRELSRSVRMMDQIYTKSKHLIVWFGLTSSLSDQISNRALESIVASPWFNRRWVIQESVLKQNATSIIMRSRLLDRHDFQLAMTEHQLDRAVYLLTSASYNNTSFDLLRNLTRFSCTKCSDPRDRVFALLSISSDGHCFNVDYAKGTADVYASVAKHYAAPQQVERLLLCALIYSHAGFAKASEGGRQEANEKSSNWSWPTWIPDWRCGSRQGNSSGQVSWPHEPDYDYSSMDQWLRRELNKENHKTGNPVHTRPKVLEDTTYAKVSLLITVRILKSCQIKKAAFRCCEACRLLPRAWRTRGKNEWCLLEGSSIIFWLSPQELEYYEHASETGYPCYTLVNWSMFGSEAGLSVNKSPKWLPYVEWRGRSPYWSGSRVAANGMKQEGRWPLEKACHEPQAIMLV